MANKTKIHKTYNYLIRAAIIVVTYGFIYRQVFKHNTFKNISENFSDLFSSDYFWWMIGLIVFMMLINWSLEAFKWKMLIKKIERVSFLKSLEAVFVGVSVSMFTPNRVGDYLGRVFILDKANRIEGVLITIIGSISQFVVTVFMGMFSMLYYAPLLVDVSGRLSGYIYFAMVVFVPIIVFLMLLFYFRIILLSSIVHVLFKKSWTKIKKYFSVFSKYSRKELFWVLMMSLARYLVFSTQFYIMLRLFSVNIEFIDGMILISVIYLVMTAIPSIALAELGIRGSVSIYLITNYFKAMSEVPDNLALAVLAASSLIWFINLVIPAFLGTFFVFNLKFFRNNKK